ncbi:MAG: TraR/DksA family transcriptional regulator [Bryobacteraceae bacterium]
MKPALVKNYRKALESRAAELSQSLRRREPIAVQAAPDLLDQEVMAAGRDEAVNNLERETRMLRQIEAALARVERNVYGVCLHCGNDISPKRLDALPWAAYCVNCQEAVDQLHRAIDFAAPHTA